LKKIRNGNVYSSVNECFNLVVTKDILDGVKSVLIKPNFLTNAPANTGVTTDFRIITSLIKSFRINGIEKIIIGESSGENKELVFKSLGVYRLRKYNVSIINFDEGKWIKVKSPTGLILKELHVPEVVNDVDLIVSAAKMKTHVITKVTLGMKNFFGTLLRSDRKIAHKIGIEESIVDVCSYFLKNKKVISFIDAIYALNGKHGPSHGVPVKMNLLIAGNDLVATDIVATMVMGYFPQKVKHVWLARKLGLGGSDYHIVGERIKDVMKKFDVPEKSPIESKLFPYFSRFFRRWPYVKNKESCTMCMACENSCPQGAIKVRGKGDILIDYRKCISCLVCCEMCKNGALSYRIKFPFSLIHKIYKTMWKR